MLCVIRPEILHYTLSKHLARHRIPLGQPDDLRRAAHKVKLNLAPLAVAVCLILVDCGGDFLFCPAQTEVGEADKKENRRRSL